MAGGDKGDFQVGEHRVLGALFSYVNLAQSELVPAGGLDHATQGLGQELRSETDGEYGDVCAVDLGQETLLGTEGWIGVVSGGRPSQQHEDVEVLGRRERRLRLLQGLSMQSKTTEAETGFAQDCAKVAPKSLDGGVLDD